MFIPDEICLFIFSHLEMNALIPNVAFTCKKWLVLVFSQQKYVIKPSQSIQTFLPKTPPELTLNNEYITHILKCISFANNLIRREMINSDGEDNDDCNNDDDDDESYNKAGNDPLDNFNKLGCKVLELHHVDENSLLSNKLIAKFAISMKHVLEYIYFVNGCVNGETMSSIVQKCDKVKMITYLEPMFSRKYVKYQKKKNHLTDMKIKFQRGKQKLNDYIDSVHYGIEHVTFERICPTTENMTLISHYFPHLKSITLTFDKQDLDVIEVSSMLEKLYSLEKLHLIGPNRISYDGLFDYMLENNMSLLNRLTHLKLQCHANWKQRVFTHYGFQILVKNKMKASAFVNLEQLVILGFIGQCLEEEQSVLQTISSVYPLLDIKYASWIVQDYCDTFPMTHNLSAMTYPCEYTDTSCFKLFTNCSCITRFTCQHCKIELPICKKGDHEVACHAYALERTRKGFDYNIVCPCCSEVIKRSQYNTHAMQHEERFQNASFVDEPMNFFWLCPLSKCGFLMKRSVPKMIDYGENFADLGFNTAEEYNLFLSKEQKKFIIKRHVRLSEMRKDIMNHYQECDHFKIRCHRCNLGILKREWENHDCKFPHRAYDVTPEKFGNILSMDQVLKQAKMNK